MQHCTCASTGIGSIRAGRPGLTSTGALVAHLMAIDFVLLVAPYVTKASTWSDSATASDVVGSGAPYPHSACSHDALLS